MFTWPIIRRGNKMASRKRVPKTTTKPRATTRLYLLTVYNNVGEPDQILGNAIVRAKSPKGAISLVSNKSNEIFNKFIRKGIKKGSFSVETEIVRPEGLEACILFVVQQ